MKKILAALTILTIFTLPAHAQVINLGSSKKLIVAYENTESEVYKPSKLVIGKKNKFVIKAPPESHISMVFSQENNGYPDFYGKKLRVGQVISNVENTTGQNGVAEIEIEIPNDKNLVGHVLYFEAVVWKKSDFSDVKVSKIIGIDGRETDVNAVVIGAAPINTSLPTFGPALPGTDMNFAKTMEMINNIKSDELDNSYEEQIYNNNQPLILRNLRTNE